MVISESEWNFYSVREGKAVKEFISKNEYLPLGRELESLHGTISSIKKIILCCFGFVLLLQLISVLSNEEYLAFKGTNLTIYSSVGIIFSFFIIAFTVYFGFSFRKELLLSFMWGILIPSALTLLIIFLVQLSFSDQHLTFFALAFLANLFLAIFVHVLPFIIINRIFKIDSRKLAPEINCTFFKESAFFIILSPDYFFAKLYKNILKSPEYNKDIPSKGNLKTIENVPETILRQQKNRLRYFIVFSNWVNFILILFIVGFLLFIDLKDVLSLDWFSFFIFLITLRIFSRVFEVIYAFFKDAISKKVKFFYNNMPDIKLKSTFNDNWRDSSIRRPERISLAIHSYIEIMLLFSIFYYFMIGLTLVQPCQLHQFKTLEIKTEECSENRNIEKVNIDQVKNDGLIEVILYSSSVTFFNVSYDYTDSTPLPWKVAHVIQVVVSIVLIVLSLASYINFPDNMDEDEIREFILIKYWDKRSDITYIDIMQRIENSGWNVDMNNEADGDTEKADVNNHSDKKQTD